jgi:hypothetical protein
MANDININKNYPGLLDKLPISPIVPIGDNYNWMIFSLEIKKLMPL